jgi:uncharacterized membrane protein
VRYRVRTPMSNAASDSRWSELDLLRGIAGVLMVINHTGYKWLGAATLADPMVSALVFAGSCAPVVFFTTTGIGYGLQVGSGRPADPRGLVRKVAILLAADALLWFSLEQKIGLDFLGFIGLSMLVLDPLRRVRRPVWIAVLGIGAITILRYGVGEAVKGWPGAGGEVMRAVLGVEATAGISYPPLPWLAYPLTGFVLGIAARRGRAFVERRFLAVIAAAMVAVAACTAATLVLVSTGRAVHRWGYVSLAFYAVSFAAIAVTVALALVLGRWGGALARRLLELRGVASLALVPWHYALIVGTAVLWDTATIGRFAWLAATVAMIVGSFALSRRTEAIAATLGAIAKRGGHIRRALVIGIALAFALKLVLLDVDAAAAFTAAVIGQVLLCLLFALPGASKPP